MLLLQTRWNSFLNMLNRALRYRITFNALIQSLPFEKVTTKIDGHRHTSYVPTLEALSEEDWSICLCVSNLLQVFGDATKSIQGQTYPVASRGLIIVHEIGQHIKNWKRYCEEGSYRVHNELGQSVDTITIPTVVAEGVAAMEYKFNKYFTDQPNNRHLFEISHCLDCRYKLMYLKHIASYSDYEIDEVKQRVRSAYENNYKLVSTTSSSIPRGMNTYSRPTTVSTNAAKGSILAASKLSQQLIALSSGSTEKDELDRYLDDGIVDFKDEDNPDILGWWRQNQLVYPTLSKMAVDFLSHQITDAMSESTFSKSGRSLDKYCSRLKDRVVESLMQGQSYLSAYGIKNLSLFDDIDYGENAEDTAMDFQNESDDDSVTSEDDEEEDDEEEEFNDD